MERDRVSGVSCKNIFNFNSHAHVERDLQSDTFHNDLVISTHTLTWSVTDQNWNGHNFVAKISTHTLTWSVTVKIDTCTNYFTFQLTRSRGA